MSFSLAQIAEPPAAGSAWVWELVTAGGAAGVALLLVLVLLSLAAVALVVEQLATVRLARLAPEGLAGRVARLIESGDVEAARRACSSGGSLGLIANAGLEEAAETPAGPGAWAAIEKAMEDAAEAEAARLLRRTDYLAVIGNLAPMVGLLGTVVGMIFAFREVAATQGAATAGELASGIYQALVTTVGGLLVAIPALGAHAVLSNRIDSVSAEVAAEADRAVRPLKRLLASRPAASVPARGVSA